MIRRIRVPGEPCGLLDVYVEFRSAGSVEASAIYRGYRVHRTYSGYSVREAVGMFGRAIRSGEIG